MRSDSRRLRKQRETRLRSAAFAPLESLERRYMLCADPGLHEAMGVPLDKHIPVSDSMPVEEWNEIANKSLSIGVKQGENAFMTSVSNHPILNSLPGAPVALYLDFDGAYYAPDKETYGAYDIDGDPNSFNAEEQARITEVWRKTSMYFSMFNVNVSTDPNVSGDRAWIVMSYDVPGGGEARINSFPDNDTAYARADGSFVPDRATGVVHELGHNFGLHHTSKYNEYGQKVDEYHNGFDLLHGTIMGADSAKVIQKFSYWHSSAGMHSALDQMSIILADLDNYGGDGYRTDDDPDGSLSTPISLTMSTPTKGVIERLNDADVYSFTVSTAGNYSVSALRDWPSPVDLSVEVYNSSNTLIASEDFDPVQALEVTNEFMPNDHHLTLNLATGTYKVKVMSHGNYSDQGQYVVRVDPLMNAANPAGSGPTRWQNGDIGLNKLPGYASYNSGTDTLTVASSGKEIDGHYDGMHYVYQPLTGNGSITLRVTGITDTGLWSQAGVQIRESLNEYSKMASMVMTPTKGAEFVWRAAHDGATAYTNTGNAAFTPTWLRLTRSGNNFTAEYSANGTTWSTLGTAQTISMNSTVMIGVAVASFDSEALNVATFSNISLTGTINAQPATNTLSAPTLTLGTATYNSMAMSWTNISGESGYSIERSTDGINYAQIATRATNVTTYTDSTGLAPAQRYWYRVRGIGSGGTVSSNISAVKNKFTRTGMVTNTAAKPRTDTQLVVEWYETSGETSYTIQRSTSQNGTYTNVATGIAANTQVWVDPTVLSPNTTYWYKVISVDASGNSATTAAFSGKTRLSQVTGLAFTSRTSTSMSFSWNAVAGATAYEIYRFNPTTEEQDLIQTQTGTSYTDTAVTAYQQCEYIVLATSTNNVSVGFSDEIEAAVPPGASQALPSGWSANDVGNVVSLGTSGKSGGTFTVVGGGASIDGTSDSFHFVCATTSATVAYIEAQVQTQEYGTHGALAGVMIRESLSPGSKYMAMYVIEDKMYVQYRTTTNGQAVWTTVAGAPTTPVKINVDRYSSTGWTAWYAPANTTNWVVAAKTSQGTLPSFSMSSSVHVGMFVSAYEPLELEQATFNTIQTNFSGGIMSSFSGTPITPSGARTRTSAVGEMFVAQPPLNQEAKSKRSLLL